MQTLECAISLSRFVANRADFSLSRKVRLAALLAADPRPPILDVAEALGISPLAAQALALEAAASPMGTSGPITTITVSDRDYPPLLRQIAAPPLALHVDGSPEGLTRQGVAIVGSRSATTYGLNAARLMGGGLARAGLTIVSGFARGIDAAAHRSAIDAGGTTIAVLGTGHEVDYPRGHAALRAQIRESGALITEYGSGTPPRPPSFPIRNRIIAGLVQAVIVIEAGVRSGSLVTARLALEQNRDVFAVPGSIFSPSSEGCHRLVQQGAKLVTSVEDVLDELGIAQDAPRILTALPPGDCGLVLRSLSADTALHVDEISESLGWTPQRLSTALLELEMSGAVSREAGGRIALRVRA